ncbi:hypothetical protein EI42_01767 [Thermosporothrix hazakensis]|jgi:hypothetical protein|uniref:Uncharacterized protein n=1 Tax=Thermosporothrix hazakensis TaxID=644383 RepID=A0A326UBC2_THEHA|nr:hypothetical protein EI42_01767 [Thermosporothrix hazakensis]
MKHMAHNWLAELPQDSGATPAFAHVYQREKKVDGTRGTAHPLVERGVIPRVPLSCPYCLWLYWLITVPSQHLIVVVTIVYDPCPSVYTCCDPSICWLGQLAWFPCSHCSHIFDLLVERVIGDDLQPEWLFSPKGPFDACIERPLTV